MNIDRRSLLKYAGLVPLLGQLPRPAMAAGEALATKADCSLHIGTALVELAPDHIVSTTVYNGQFPGPLLRFKEGERVVIDVHNDTDTPELVHWHGQMVPSDVDGAAEEGTPLVPPHQMRRLAFVPKPSGFRFYHTHVPAMNDLNRGTYTGQAGPLYVEPRQTSGAHDREVFLVLKDSFQPLAVGGIWPWTHWPERPSRCCSNWGSLRTKQRRRKRRVSRSITSCSASMAGSWDTGSPFE